MRGVGMVPCQHKSWMKACAVRVFLLLLAAGAMFCGGCNRGSGSDAEHRYKALVVCPGATDILRKKWENTDQVSYRIVVSYPAESVLSCISNKLSQTGWEPLKEDYWNPGFPSSHVRGWTQFADASVQPQSSVDQWLGQWKDGVGSIVWYSLQYRYPPGDRNHLTVAAGYIPADVASRIGSGPSHTINFGRVPSADVPEVGHEIGACPRCGMLRSRRGLR